MLNSKYFKQSEFDCHSGEPYPEAWVDTHLQKLCGQLDKIRDAWGGPVTVICGYRSAAYNAKLRATSPGVAEHSQHILGTAADIAPVPRTPGNVQQLCSLINHMLAAGELSGVGGFGVYPGWSHVDVRDKPTDGHVARWTGAGFGSEVVAP